MNEFADWNVQVSSPWRQFFPLVGNLLCLKTTIYYYSEIFSMSLNCFRGFKTCYKVYLFQLFFKNQHFE